MCVCVRERAHIRACVCRRVCGPALLPLCHVCYVTLLYISCSRKTSSVLLNQLTFDLPLSLPLPTAMDPDGLGSNGLSLVEAAVCDLAAAAAPLPCLGKEVEEQHQQLKESVAKGLQVQKPAEVDLLALEEHLLTHNMVDMEQSSSTVINTTVSLGNLPLPDLFPQNIKQEAPLRLPQQELEGFTSSASLGVSDVSVGLMEDSEIWQNLDLPPTLPDISDFELVSEVEHLDHILHQGSDGAAAATAVTLLRNEIKPPPVGNGGTATAVNGTGAGHQQQHLHPQLPASLLLSSVTIKEEEKDTEDFLLSGATQVVKQEKTDDPSFCQQLCLHQGAGAAAAATYSYSSLQKPFSLGENWSCSRFSESNLGNFSLTR